MAGDKFDQLYNALKADGAVSGTREHFRQFVYAPGKQGYHNRKQLYDALYADGAVSSKSYEEFAQRLGLHAVNPKPQQKAVAQQKPMTTSQRAQDVASQYQKGKQTKQPVDYLHRPQSQMGRLQRNVPAKASPFVRSLYEIDNAQKGPDYSVDYTSPKATQQVYQQNQHVRRQAAQTASDHIANDEYRRQSQPMIDNGTVGVMKPMGEIEQEMSDSARKFVDANLGDYINKAVLGEQNAAGKRAVDAYNNSFAAGGGGGGGINDLLMRSLAYNEENDPDKMIENLAKNARGGLEKLFQNPSFVAKVKNEADMLGVTPEAYVESILPHLKDRLSAALEKSEYNKYLPKDALENMTNRFIDSNTIGKLVRGATMTRGQRIMQERASAATAAGENPYYKGSTVENVVADVAGMVSDPVFKGAAGAGGKVAGKLIGNNTKLAALMANGNLAQRLMAKGAQAVTSGGVTGFVFDSTGSVIQNYSTGEDTSLGNTLKVAAKGGTTGSVNFATMSLAGIPLSEVGRSIGLKAVKGGSFWGNTGRATAKIGLESGKTYMEAMGMYLGGYVSGKLEGRTDANGKPIEFDLWNGTMESLPTAIGFRLQHAVEGLRGGRKNEKGEDMGWFGSTIANFKDFLTSDKAKESRFLMTDDERNQIFSSGAMNGLMPDGENIVSYAKRTKNKKVSYEDPYLETDASMIKNTYDQIMADPKVSWDAKAKFSAMVTGIMPSARPMMDYITYSSEDYVKDGLLIGKRKYVNEYSAKGELLSKIPYDSKVDRDNVVYKHNIVRENQRLYNAMGLLARQDRNNYELQNDFFVENMKKPGADVNILVTNMGDEGSHVFRDFSLFALNSEKGTVLKTIYSVAVRNGMKSEDLIKAMKKNPMKRSDFEQNVCVELRRALEAKAFPDGKVHAEQSSLNGKDIAEDNNLGTEQPNGDAVKQELNGLRQAEAEMDTLIRDNDIFSQNFKKLQSQGLTNPQIYDWMVQQGGLTVEQLEPFAHYINANARVQGMQEATKQKIEETVSVFAQDWSYHGTLNGQPMNGEQALYVQDSNGRTLLVGSGYVAFYQTTGRAKEGSGDMLVCLDLNTKEMLYVKADEVTLFQNQPIDQFAAEYRQRLQMKNSEPYNHAAQEQAMLDAAKAQKEGKEPQDNTTKSEDNTTNSGDLIKDDTTLTKVDTTSGEDNTTNEKLAPQDQPQPSRKFVDGTEVPMTTDSKGRPTPDYASMTPEQSAEILTEDFGENAEKVVDGQIQKAEKALKDAEKMKVDYTAEPNDIMEQEALKKKTVEAAKKQLDHAQNIKKVMTAKKVAETVERPVEPERAAYGVAQEAGVVSPKVKERFEASKKIKGRRGSITLADGTKIRGTYYYGETSGLTTSHDPFNDFKQSEGFPVNEDGTSSNSRSYRDKESRLFTQKIGNDFNGLALKNVPVVQEGITLSGNGTVMGKKLAEQAGKDSKYYEDLEDNAEGFGWTPEQINGAGFKGIVYFVPDEKLPLNSKTFDLFNKKETKSESNTEQAVKNAKTLTSNEVGAIVAEIEGNGSLEAFFNNSKAINDLVKTLVDKGIIGQNEVAQMMDSPERLSAQGREYVKNLLLGSIFKPETIRMLGIDSTVKNKAINAIRSVMDNMKLGEFSLRDEIDQAIQLLYEARQGGNKVDTLLRTPSMFGEDAAKRYPSISQMMALALEGKVADFRDLLDEYNRIAAARNTGEGNVFGEAPTKPELIKEFLDFKKWQDYGTGHSENERGNDVSGVEEPKQEASGGNEPAEAGEGRVKSEDEDKPNSAGFTPKEIRDHQEKLDRAKEKYVKALKEAKSEKEIKAAEDEFEFTYKDHQNMTGVLDEASVADMWKKELKSAKDSVKKDSKEPSADPMEGIKQAADAFHEEQKQKGEFAMNLKIGKARQDYAAAKESGDAERTTKAAKELKHLLDDRLKQEGKGLAERQKIIAEEIGKAEAEIIDKPWEQMDLEEREAVSSKNPLTESEINELTSEENKELIPAALAYLRGDKGNIINAISYFKIWNDVRNRHENVSGNSGTENGTQLDAADTTGGEGLGLGRGRESGRPDGPVDRGAGNEAAPGERNGREGDQNDTTLSAGEQGNKQGEGNSSGMGAVPAGSSDTNGGGSASGNGHVSGGSGRESSKRPADTNAGRKPTAKQGTTFPDSTAERLKQERADYEKKKKDFWARWKKAGQGYAKIALTPFKKLNLTPEQIEMLPELFKMHLNGAVLKIKEGIYKFNEWKAAMLAEEGEELKMIGLSDDDIDRFIEDYWNTPYEMNGETHTIREWSSIYGNQQLKKKLKEPLEEKYKRQMEAEPIEVKVGDMKNIEETLPYLLPQQQEDVLKAETQFFGKEHTDREHAYGKGYLFTNGTGTGKTYTGLGIAKRLAKQGKGRILFITPSQKKVSDWIKDGKNLGLDIKDLDSWAKERGTTATTESGEGMVITTFANFGLNKKLLETEWDAVIYDECHRIMENKKGTETARSMQHYMVTNRDENHCFQRLQSINPEYQKMNGAAEKFDALRLKEIDRIKKEYKNSHPSATNRDVDNATLKSLPRDLNSFAPADGMTFPKLGKAYQDFIKARDAYNKVEPKLKEQAKDSWKNTKTIFLSATPFNTRENLDYVEGYIFKYPETDERGMGGRTQFYLNHFGAAYKFRYHRLEQSISNPDAVAKQEVAFSDYLQNTLGTMSGRIIDSPYDYSRDFPTVAPDHAEDFNNAVQDTLKTKYLHDAYSKTIGDYNYGSALFETMKVSAAIDRIKQHLGLGRKVVIFHRRVESKEPLEAPFAYMLRVANEQIKMMKPGKERDEYIKECTEFRNKYADLLEWEKTLDYSMPREQIAKVFGEKNVLFFSGKESKKVKDKAIDTFNDDDSGKNIIVIQEASGKEGISLHDTTSKHQRVCITLALPQSPITALQIEGRIYRIGNMSNAIFEYPILGLNSEMMLFGEKFNNQVSTTENLALGSQARNLRDSFAKGILEHSGIVPVENQGVGGKEFDAATPSENDPFDNAVLDYYSNQKLNKNNREGSDYFPTPEPLGYKMVEWAGLGEGDSVLEPSAGHGAIARYVPKTNEMVSIEPSQSLFTKLQLRAGGLGRKFMNNTFENYSLNNKHDVIVMNPPFGKAGALAIQHVDKAFKHLDEGGRIVAIIPRGSTDKKFDKWYNEQKNVAMRAEVNLPDILFQQAGTRVACRVVVLDKISDAALRSKAGYPEKIDLSGHYDKIEDFFNDLRDIEMPERIIDTNLKMQKKAKAAVKDIMEIKGVKNVSYGKTGIDVSLTGSWMNYGISFTGSDKPNYWRDKMANYYNKYDELQKLEYQENKQSVFDELKKLSCKLAGMTEDEMQRYIASKSNGGTHFREDHGDGNYPASSVESHVEKVAKKTGAKVNMVSSFDEITNKAAKAAVEEGRKITGWYDEKTGEVHLYMPNIHDRYTAEKTIWHEVVGHKGMRELFGEDRFNQFLRDVWYDLDKPENAELKKLVDEERKFNPLNIYDAIEEGIARLAEDGKGEPGFWNGIKNKVSDFLHEIGYRIAPNTKDVKYLLWLSKNLQKNPNDPYWKLRAEAVKYRLDHDRVPAVVEKNGMFYGNEGKVRSMESMTKSEWNEATDGQIHFRTTPSAGTALDRYHRSLDEHGYMFTESYMDNMLSLKMLMNAIVPDKKIEDIASSENPYMLQNTMQGAMSDAAQMFERNVMKPLDKAMAGVLDAFDGKKDDEKIRNFNLYMITKHGLERNRVFFVRDFLRQMRMDEQKKQDADILENRWGKEKERLDNELNAGNIDLKEYYRQMDEFISNEIDPDYKAGEHDYSGIHAIQEVSKSSDPYDDAEAIQSVMDSEAKMESIKKGSVKDYWDKVKAATQYSIDSDYKNGIISKELHGHVSNMFNWYVPLRKYDEATAEDTYGYITELGDTKNYIGSTIMRARGHKYLSETNVLAQIGAMGNRAIKNGGLNAIKMAFARFARNNSNNNLITEVSVWYEKDPMTGIVYERYPDIPEDATPDEINQIVADFNTDMKAKSAQGLASKVYRRGSIGYKFQRAENKSQHIVDVKIAGRTHYFIINGNPRAAQALNGLLEHKNDTLAGRVAASISRNMAQLCTSYNPEFVMRNMIKDFEFASTNLLAKEGFRYTKLFEQYYAKVGIIEGIRNSKLKDFADTGGFGLFAKYRNGTLDTNDKVQRYFKEFMENGGETGWVQIKNMKDWTKEYKLHVKGERNKVQKVGKGFYNAIFKNLENINEIAENLARFSTYCASRDYGRSVIRSVYDAKVVSTNFNRHGSGNAIYSFKNGEMGAFKTARKNIYGFWAAWFRNSSMFFNAGIQSTNLLIKNFKNNKAGTIGYIASAPFISGMAMALLNNFIISNEDEKDRKGVKDPYGELPDYIRRNNLCVYIGGGEFVTIPLAIEERAFYGLGDLAAGMTFSKNISSQKMPNLTENKDIDKYLNPFMDAVGCMSQLVPVADYLGNASFGKHPWQETIKALAPSATSPFLEWVYNSDWKGAPIQRDNKFDENQPSWMLAYKGTPEWMINMNKKVNALTNDVAPGNEDMKGNDFLDAVTNPSALHHFYGSYFGGAATFVERVGGLIKNGKDTETKDIPFLRSLLYTPSEQSSLQRTKSKWYNYKDEMEKTMANVDRLKSKNVPIDKRITNIGEYYHFQNSKEAAKVRVIELAEKQMDRWKKMRDKASDTESINFANQNIDRIMMDAVDDLDKLN